MKKFKKNIITMAMMAMVVTSVSPAVFAQENTTASTIVENVVNAENVELDNTNYVVVYEANGYSFFMDKDIYASYSEAQIENLEKLYSKLAEEQSIQTRGWWESVTDHVHNYMGPYRHKYSNTTYMTNSSGNLRKVDHYVCDEEYSLVCPYEKVYLEDLR